MINSYRISLIICTFQRPHSLLKLLNSIYLQKYIPFEIIIVDGSYNDSSQQIVFDFLNRGVKYFRVHDENRGLTKQRNYGLSKLSNECDFVAFLDDDLTLDQDYFLKLIEVFEMYPDAIGAGGIDILTSNYELLNPKIKYNKFFYFELDGWVSLEPKRYLVRKILGLMPNSQPGFIPLYSNGRSSLPPSGKIYQVEHLIGMSMMFKKSLFNQLKFSNYFNGYGLYEDFDFCVRSLKFGKLYVNTNALVQHYHDYSGRPNSFNYGLMVSRNGWYVWKQRFNKTSFKSSIMWHLILLLMAFLKLLTTFSGPKRKDSFLEFSGRIYGWFSILFFPPKIIK